MKLNKKITVIRRRVFPIDNFWEVYIHDIGVYVEPRKWYPPWEIQLLNFELIYRRKMSILEVLIEVE